MKKCECGKEIVFGVNASGKTVPLELTQHAYNGLNTPYAPLYEKFEIAKPPVPIYISHFLTCPMAKKFSRKNEKEKTQPEKLF